MLLPGDSLTGFSSEVFIHLFNLSMTPMLSVSLNQIIDCPEYLSFWNWPLLSWTRDIMQFVLFIGVLPYS